MPRRLLAILLTFVITLQSLSVLADTWFQDYGSICGVDSSISSSINDKFGNLNSEHENFEYHHCSYHHYNCALCSDINVRMNPADVTVGLFEQQNDFSSHQTIPETPPPTS